MHLSISTKVRAYYLQVKEGFTQDLFLKLNPPFPPVKLLRFDGCKKGNQVILELNFILFKQKWESDITMDNTDDKVFEFVDVGVRLPFFLKSWNHHHIVRHISENECEIVDDIHFNTPFILLDYLMYPALYLQFLYRKPIYRKIFNL